jgi:hypothetical protein
MADKLHWDHPEVVALRQREDRAGIAQLVREGRLELSARNPYRKGIPVESSPDSPGANAPSGEPLTRAEFEDMQRRGAVRELREAAAAGRIPWSPSNPHAPRPTITQGDES